MAAVLWGSELSPYFLKIEALCRFAGLAVQRRPDGGGTLENLRLMMRLKRAQAQRTVRRWPSFDPLDEYPLVPYLFTEDGAVHMDSSGIAGWLDEASVATHAPLIPSDPALGFVCSLIDEALDEVGLYCVHHQRWVVSRRDNDAGRRLAHEFRSLVVAPLRPVMARRFSRRQTRRLPYLFSVAEPRARWPEDGLPQPPAHPGFAATHARLEQAWDELVDAATQALAHRPYLLGERFTLADAALYGQLGMNLSDPSSERRLRERSPRLRAWLGSIAAGRHVQGTGELSQHQDLQPLLSWIGSTFVPLMRANMAAYLRQHAQGQRRWNEAAFDRGEARYDLGWRGGPARSVVKTFQVRVWRDLYARYAALPPEALNTLGDINGWFSDPASSTGDPGPRS
ncbi:MAG: glutathione S-transferase C-terminal domain-containing protein [Sinimarinibacterium sp.]|jgi:glutathione S-transferase